MTSINPRGNRGPFDVLLVESDPDAASPLIDSFKRTDATETVHVVTDGDEALDFLYQRGDYADVPRPDIVLLDLQVPGTNGEEILSELHEQPELRRIPVLVLTGSDAGEAVARSYELNANAHLQKPSTAAELASLASAIEEFWLRLAHLPPT